jgi:hypothetical protein
MVERGLKVQRQSAHLNLRLAFARHLPPWGARWRNVYSTGLALRWPTVPSQPPPGAALPCRIAAPLFQSHRPALRGYRGVPSDLPVTRKRFCPDRPMW